MFICSFFCNDTPTSATYTLSLHDALPISGCRLEASIEGGLSGLFDQLAVEQIADNLLSNAVKYGDRKSTRLNSSHMSISYAVFCLKKKNQLKESHFSTLLGLEVESTWTNP